jgi:predicted TIM-barrel fold metal-dependent hydrolase
MIGGLAGVQLAFRTVGELVREMQHLSIARALVFHAPYGATCENELLLEALRGKRNLQPVASAMPWETSRERLTARTREILETKACGVRLFPATERFDFSRAHLKEIMAIVARRRLPVMVDADQVGFGALGQMLKAHPKVPFILAKVGVGNNRYVYDLLDGYPNLFIETSLLRACHAIEDVAARFGAKRILFGTYLPLLDGGAAVTRVIYSGLSRREKEQVAFGNLEDILSGIRR